jgi:predicted ATPase
VQRFIVTGAPGTGKTALVTALAHVGETFGEPARELIAEHAVATGERSLDNVPELFVERLIQRSIDKYDSAPASGTVIYDRGLPDCIAYAQGFEVDSAATLMAAQARRYADPVFIAPPWEAIYTVDELRRMTFAMVEAFHDDLVEAYETLGYDLVELPKSTVADRVAFIESCLDHSGP